MTHAPITPALTLKALVKQFPETLDVLHAIGVDTPWEGDSTLARVAHEHQLALPELLETLNNVVDNAAAAA
jgi:iron-sulfur cluster repair protein YtfE (RIC family)